MKRRLLVTLVICLVSVFAMSACASDIPETQPNQIYYNGLMVTIGETQEVTELGEWEVVTEDNGCFLIVNYEIENVSEEAVSAEDLTYIWLEDEEYIYDLDVELQQAYADENGIDLDAVKGDIEPGETVKGCVAFITEFGATESSETYLYFVDIVTSLYFTDFE